MCFTTVFMAATSAQRVTTAVVSCIAGAGAGAGKEVEMHMYYLAIFASAFEI